MLRAAIRFLVPLLAVLFAIDWFVAPSTLSVDGATRLEVVAKRVEPRRRQAYASLVTASGDETQIACSKTARLCESLQRSERKPLTVWVVEPGWFYGTWLVAANDQSTPLVTTELQNRIYRGARAINVGAILLFTAIALFLWRTHWLRYLRRRTRN